jgi:serpin B
VIGTTLGSLPDQIRGDNLPEFIRTLQRHYGVGVGKVDFRGAPEKARQIINGWVEQQTRGTIKELLPPGILSRQTALVLVNAVYFKGMWVLQFGKEATHVEPFHLDHGAEVQVPLMHRHTTIRYLKGAGYQAVDLDYSGGDLSMLVLLPDKHDGLEDLETRFSARMVEECVEQMGIRGVELFLPRFKITWGTVEIRDQLRALGMTLAFDRSRADFSGINGHEPSEEESLFISAVFHKAFVDVNEEGTEAAAATSAMMDLLSARRPPNPPPVAIFRADHPFVFAIRDRRSGAILFLGRMSNPTSEK